MKYASNFRAEYFIFRYNENLLNESQDEFLRKDFANKIRFYANEFAELNLGLSDSKLCAMVLDIIVESIILEDYFQKFVRDLLITEEHLIFLKKFALAKND